MNRMEEYQALRATAEQPAAGLEDTLTRARKRLRRRRAMVLRPLTGLAACFAVFVVLVNFCAPVAYACSKVPGLRELAEAVTFSRSLTDAVNNEYVQPIDLKQTKNGITASVEYLIVDQKQVNVFFRNDSLIPVLESMVVCNGIYVPGQVNGFYRIPLAKFCNDRGCDPSGA